VEWLAETSIPPTLMLDIKKENFLAINHIIILVKKYIYKCKLEQTDLSINAFIRLLKSTIDLEYFCAQRSASLDTHFRKWNVLLN